MLVAERKPAVHSAARSRTLRQTFCCGRWGSARLILRSKAANRVTPARRLSEICCSSESPIQEQDDLAASPVTGTADLEGDTGNPLSERPAFKQSRGGADKKVSSFVRNTATTFAPRASTATKNPAYKGSTLYTIFGVQAWVSLVVGGLLSFNVIFPTDKPSIARLIGMWSVWMFTIPALRARECTSAEKDALNTLFLLVPLLNVTLPLVWKSFPFIFAADCLAMGSVYFWKVGLPDKQNS